MEFEVFWGLHASPRAKSILISMTKSIYSIKENHIYSIRQRKKSSWENETHLVRYWYQEIYFSHQIFLNRFIIETMLLQRRMFRRLRKIRYILSLFLIAIETSVRERVCWSLKCWKSTGLYSCQRRFLE